MAPSEETTTTTCSQQQEQGVVDAKLREDTPKIKDCAPSNHEENIVSVVQRPNGDGTVCVENINPHVNSMKNLSISESVVGRSTISKEDIDHIRDDSECVVDIPNISGVVTENVGQGEDSVVVNSVNKRDQILDGPKKFDINRVENVDQVVTNSISVTAADLDDVNRVLECPSSVVGVLTEEEVVACGCVDDTPEVMDSQENDVSARIVTCVESMASASSVSNEWVANVSADNVHHVTSGCRVGCNEGKDFLFLYLAFSFETARACDVP